MSIPIAHLHPYNLKSQVSTHSSCISHVYEDRFDYDLTACTGWVLDYSICYVILEFVSDVASPKSDIWISDIRIEEKTSFCIKNRVATPHTISDRGA